ncbi:hypothetical protein [Cupriavidus pinatubonensis]|uniref:hypothetical protein n=1 Tax=Cupriavidus pinatubonensis TaxID=248026 RepID=UPI002159FAA1|nr:hypothetical protein [Cupriavidus pinatubonensis]
MSEITIHASAPEDMEASHASYNEAVENTTFSSNEVFVDVDNRVDGLVARRKAVNPGSCGTRREGSRRRLCANCRLALT